MIEKLKALAEKMAEEYSNSMTLQMFDDDPIAESYLAGFEARDEIVNEEHAEMLRILQTVVLMRNIRMMFPSVHEEIKSLITKIESK